LQQIIRAVVGGGLWQHGDGGAAEVRALPPVAADV
jgi:hypothetical protein